MGAESRARGRVDIRLALYNWGRPAALSLKRKVAQVIDLEIGPRRVAEHPGWFGKPPVRAPGFCTLECVESNHMELFTRDGSGLYGTVRNC